MSETIRPAAVPATSTEAALAEMWRDLLGRAEVGPEDHFFDAGGTSLSAIKLLQRVAKRFGPDALSPDTLYEDPRLGALARAVDRATGRG
ncbi:phosphopantetheine-binding protein [Streptomyces anulatus]|uniref:phosphopantetheine-binding protein n=1 Tax=Streptomyces anulatus TaxID=1892 RepID=UPI00369E1AA1